MEKYEVEALLKSYSKTFEALENGYALVDDIAVDYSFSYHGNISYSFKRLLSPKNSLVLSSEMNRDQIIHLLNEIKSEEIRDDFTLEEISHNNFKVVIDGENCEDVNITFEKGFFILKENYLSNKKANKKILAKLLLDKLNIHQLLFITNNLYKENYYLEFLDKENLLNWSVINYNIFFNDIIFTFKKSDF
jgi:hypothetical protein